MSGPPSIDRAPLFVVFNAGSGHGDADEFRSRIEAACRAAARSLTVLQVEPARSVDALAKDAVQRARAVGGIVVAAGGDGTINAVAQATLGSGCAFGVLPQGTFNYFSRTHGVSSQLDVSLQQLLTGRVQAVQVGLVNDRVFLVNASLGLYPKLLEDREAYKKLYGRSRLVAFGAGLLTLLGGHRGLHLRIDADGERAVLRTPTLFVGNNALQLAQIGIPEAAVIEHGQLAAITLRPLGRLAMTGLLLRGAIGRLGEADRVASRPVRHLTVDNVRRQRRLKVATDGEVQWMGAPLHFQVAPDTLWLIRPLDAPPLGSPPAHDPA